MKIITTQFQVNLKVINSTATHIWNFKPNDLEYIHMHREKQL